MATVSATELQGGRYPAGPWSGPQPITIELQPGWYRYIELDSWVRWSRTAIRTLDGATDEAIFAIGAPTLEIPLGLVGTAGLWFQPTDTTVDWPMRPGRLGVLNVSAGRLLVSLMCFPSNPAQYEFPAVVCP